MSDENEMTLQDFDVCSHSSLAFLFFSVFVILPLVINFRLFVWHLIKLLLHLLTSRRKWALTPVYKENDCNLRINCYSYEFEGMNVFRKRKYWTCSVMFSYPTRTVVFCQSLRWLEGRNSLDNDICSPPDDTRSSCQQLYRIHGIRSRRQDLRLDIKERIRMKCKYRWI